MQILNLLYSKEEPLRFMSYVLIIYSSYILLNIGNGLNGIHIIILFFTSILSILISRMYKKQKIYTDIKFDIVTFIIILILIIWISLIDYFFVEIFKITTANLLETSNSYWLIVFSGLLPILIYSFVTFFFVITRNLANTIRFILVSVFLLNSALNDFLYYYLFKIELPKEWTWIYQPRILFGDIITTRELFIWLILNFTAIIIIYIIPFENITPDNLEKNNDNHQKIWIDYCIIILLLVFNILYIQSFIPIIKSEITKINQEIVLKKKEENNLLLKNQTDIQQNYNFITKQVYESKINILNETREYLTRYYELNGNYPISEGNCTEKWDSSNTKLPFDDFSPTDIFDKGESCDFSKNSNPILYYSDGKMYALLISARGLEDMNNILEESESFLYIPEKRDVMWFQNESTYFWKDWRWASPMIVYMVILENNVTQFNNINN